MPSKVNWEDDAHEEGIPPEEAPTTPKFSEGDKVSLNDADHDRFKRRPEYAKGATGEIQRIHGAYNVPAEEDETEEYEFLYSVEFSHTDVWGDSHPESNGTLSLDLWEETLNS